MKKLIYISSLLILISSFANAHEVYAAYDNLNKCVNTYDLSGDSRVVVKYKTCLPRFLLLNRYPTIDIYQSYSNVTKGYDLDESRFQFSNEVMHISEYLPEVYKELNRDLKDSEGNNLIDVLVYQLSSNKDYNGDKIKARQDIIRILYSKE